MHQRKPSAPAAISGRASIRDANRPSTAIVIADEIAPGRITSPVWFAVKSCSPWRKTGSTNTEPKSAKPSSIAIATPVASCRLLSTRKLITGSFAVSSRHTSPTNDRPEITASDVTNGDSNQS